MTHQKTKKLIFYIEDDPGDLMAHIQVLRETYDVIIGAGVELFEKLQGRAVDLLIVDLMIHKHSLDETKAEVSNLYFSGIGWERTGIEFLHRVRQGDYEATGLRRDVSIIVATAVVDYQVREEAAKEKISFYLEKPFTIEDLENAVQNVLSA